MYIKRLVSKTYHTSYNSTTKKQQNVKECKRMRPVKTIPGTGRGGIKENDGGGKFNCDIW
jgi:hypothetical protein